MNKSSTWNLHLLAGIVLIFLLGIHMITTHLDLIVGWFNPAGGAGIDWGNVTARGSHMSWMIFYIAFLGIALYHGLYGLRTILFELGVTRKLEKLITTVFVIAGICLFVIGSIATITFKSGAMGV